MKRTSMAVGMFFTLIGCLSLAYAQEAPFCCDEGQSYPYFVVSNNQCIPANNIQCGTNECLPCEDPNAENNCLTKTEPGWSWHGFNGTPWCKCTYCNPETAVSCYTNNRLLIQNESSCVCGDCMPGYSPYPYSNSDYCWDGNNTCGPPNPCPPIPALTIPAGEGGGTLNCIGPYTCFYSGYATVLYNIYAYPGCYPYVSQLCYQYTNMEWVTGNYYPCDLCDANGYPVWCQ